MMKAMIETCEVNKREYNYNQSKKKVMGQLLPQNQLIVFIKNKMFHLFKIEKATMSTYCINVFCSCPSKLCHRMLCIKWSPASINFCKRITKSKLLRHLVKTVYSSTIYHSY